MGAGSRRQKPVYFGRQSVHNQHRVTKWRSRMSKTNVLSLAFNGDVQPRRKSHVTDRASSPTSEENQSHFSRATEANEGVFCSDDRILLGLIAASLVLPRESSAAMCSTSPAPMAR